MRRLGVVSEDAMVLEFLASEIDSPRFADVVLAALTECGADETVIRDRSYDGAATAARAAVLGSYRGWKTGRALFRGFPSVSWFRVAATAADVRAVQLGAHPAWLNLPFQPRTVGDVALGLRTGLIEPKSHVAAVRQRYGDGDSLPLPIVVGGRDTKATTVLEGHTRLVAWLLAAPRRDGDARGTDEIELILGVADSLAGWCFLA